MEPEDDRIRMRDIDLLRGQKKPRVQLRNLELLTPWLLGVEGQGEACIAEIERIEEGFTADQVGIVDLQSHLVDRGENAPPIVSVQNTHLFRHEPANRIKRKSAERHLHAALVKLA